MHRVRGITRFIGVLVVWNALSFAVSAQMRHAELSYPGSDVLAPKLIHKEAPVYPIMAQEAGIQGDILIAATIDVSGTLRDVAILTPLTNELDQAALNCVSTWRFSPAMEDGKPIAFRAVLQVNFRLIGRPFNERVERRRVGEKAIAALFVNQQNGRPTQDSIELMQFLSSEGWEQAEYWVGLWQVRGELLPKNSNNGLKLIQKAADQGDLNARIFAGDALIDGNGVPRNVKRGLLYLRKAAEAGSIDAEQDLGQRYMDGTGVVADPVKATKYLQLCAQAGRSECQRLVDRLSKEGR